MQTVSTEDLIKEDLPIVHKAYSQMVEKFPAERFKMYWEPATSEFFIVTDNFELKQENPAYMQMVSKLYNELFNKTHFNVIITRTSFGDIQEEYEVNNFSKNKEGFGATKM